MRKGAWRLPTDWPRAYWSGARWFRACGPGSLIDHAVELPVIREVGGRPMFDEESPRRRKSLEQRREKARSHPLRVKILALHQQDLERSLAAPDLLPTLTAARTAGEGDLSVSTVAYHVRVLQDAELIPA